MKPKVILSVVAVVLIVYLAIVNQNLKTERTEAVKEAKELKSAADAPVQIHRPAANAAEDFIRSYFEYEGQQDKDKVMQLVTSNMEDQLSFAGEEGEIVEGDNLDENNEEVSVNSKITSLEIFYGASTEDRQQLFATFNNTIEFNGEGSEAISYLKLDMMMEDGKWKVDDIEFNQS